MILDNNYPNKKEQKQFPASKSFQRVSNVNKTGEDEGIYTR